MRRALLGFSTLLAASTPAWIAGCQGGDAPSAPQDTSLSVVSPSNVSANSAAPDNARGPNISVDFHPVDHTVAPDAAFFLAELTIENHSSVRLGASGWQINFNFVRRILNEGEGNATLRQALTAQGVQFVKADAAKSGDYWALQPLPNFVPIAPGGKRVITLLAENWAIQKTDAPAGFHIFFPPNTQAFAIHATTTIDPSDPKQTKRFVGDVLPTQTPALRYDENISLQKVNVDRAHSLLPTPQSVQAGPGSFRLSHAGISASHGLAREAAYLRAALEDAGVDAHDGGDHAAIRLSIDAASTSGPESYTLRIDPAKGVDIRGADAAGVFYGIQTLRQLLGSGSSEGCHEAEATLPEITVSDAPLFSYRGMTLDVARHFQTKATVEKLLDVLAFHKINKLHLRLADDEGWRLEIPGIDELTSFGAHRGYDVAESTELHPGLGSSNDLLPGDHILGKPRSRAEANGGEAPAFQGFETATLNYVGKGNGFYTVHEFEELLAYAAERHIDVIPEFDAPGHARAAVKSMEARFAKFAKSDPVKAAQYRLVDPNDTSKHTSVQAYTDNFINPCLPSTYAFLGKVIHEVQARYQAAGAKLSFVHAGGDELPAVGPGGSWWQGSPLCKSNPDTKSLDDIGLRDYFFKHYQPIIAATGAGMTGWDDIIHDGLALDGFVPMPWSNVWTWGREDDAYVYANSGKKVILSHATNLYMDLAYNKDPDEPGYYWANFVDESKTFNYLPFDVFAIATQDRMGNPIDPSTWNGKVHLTAAGKANILGMQGLLFGENIKSPELLEYFSFPKILGVAERAWNRNTPTAADLPAAWQQFVNVLGQAELPRLDAYRPVDLRDEIPDSAVGVNYRIPLPGAKIDNGKLIANVRYPGLAIEYSTDGGSSFVTYEGPVAVSGSVIVRTKAHNGRTSREAKVQ